MSQDSVPSRDVLESSTHWVHWMGYTLETPTHLSAPHPPRTVLALSPSVPDQLEAHIKVTGEGCYQNGLKAVLRSGPDQIQVKLFVPHAISCVFACRDAGSSLSTRMAFLVASAVHDPG